MSIAISNPIAHEERGRVERRIRLIRYTLEQINTTMATPVQTSIQWETQFAKVANIIDDTPLAKGNQSSTSPLGWEILTANRIKLGRNNNRSLTEYGISLEMTSNYTRLLERNRLICNHWFQLFMHEIHNINLRPMKWANSGRLPETNDIVLFVITDSSTTKQVKQWKLGKVVACTNRSVKILSYTAGEKAKNPTPHFFERSPRDVTILFSMEELYPNSKAYFNDCHKQK